MNNHDATSASGGKSQVHPFWRGPRIAGARYEILVEHRDRYQVARVIGELPIELFISTLHVLGIESDGGSEPSMLIDLRGLSTIYSAADLVRVGQEIATSFIHMNRLALLVPPRRVTRISERAARRTGMNMCVFKDEEGATGWASAA